MRNNYTKSIVTLIAACVITAALTASYMRKQDTAFIKSPSAQSAAESNAAQAPAAEETELAAYGLYLKMNEALRNATHVKVQASYEVLHYLDPDEAAVKVTCHVGIGRV